MRSNCELGGARIRPTSPSQMDLRNVRGFWGGRASKIAQEGKRLFGPNLRVMFLPVGTPLPMGWALRPSFKQASGEGSLELLPQRELTGTLKCAAALRGLAW